MSLKVVFVDSRKRKTNPVHEDIHAVDTMITRKRQKKMSWNQVFETLTAQDLDSILCKKANIVDTIQDVLGLGSGSLDDAEQNHLLFHWRLFVYQKAQAIAKILRVGAVLYAKEWKKHHPTSISVGTLRKFLPALKSESARMIVAGWETFLRDKKRTPTTTRPTVAQVLEALSPSGKDNSDSGIRNIETNTNGVLGRAYYTHIQSTSFDFRHEGVPKKRPPQIHLRDFSNYDDEVLVFCSSSGTGKSVELAGSSVTRAAHLTIVIIPRDPAATLGDAVEDVFVQENLSSAFPKLLDAAKNEGVPLKLVIAIDKASRFPTMVRSLVQNPRWAKHMVSVRLFKTIVDFCPDWRIDVVFSVAGIGALVSTIASSPCETTRNNFVVKDPTFLKHNREIRTLLLESLPAFLVKGRGDERKPLHLCIDAHLPVVAVLMENGRMASIALAALKQHPTNAPIVERTLAWTIVRTFVKGNGLDHFLNSRDARYYFIAAAMAVELFQQGPQPRFFPTDSYEYQEMVSQMNFAVSLSKDAKSYCSVKTLVSRCGILEPNYNESEQIWKAGAEIKRPFVMRPSMQILTLLILEPSVDSMPVATPHGFESRSIGRMAMATPYDFESLSIDLLKCALAASMSISNAKRPTLEQVLAKVGFRFGEDYAKCDFMSSASEKVKSCKVAGFQSSRKNAEESLRHTCHIRADFLIDETSGDLHVNPGSRHTSPFSFRQPPKPDNDWNTHYRSPKTRSWHRNNNKTLCSDGFVTFFAKKDGEPGSSELFTVVIKT